VETIESLEQHLVETLEDNSYSSESAKFLGGQIAVLLSNPPKVNKALLTQLRLECLVPSKIVQKLMLENFDREGVYHSDRVRKVGNGSNKCSFFAESEFESPLGVSFLAQAESDTKEDAKLVCLSILNHKVLACLSEKVSNFESMLDKVVQKDRKAKKSKTKSKQKTAQVTKTRIPHTSIPPATAKQKSVPDFKYEKPILTLPRNTNIPKADLARHRRTDLTPQPMHRFFNIESPLPDIGLPAPNLFPPNAHTPIPGFRPPPFIPFPHGVFPQLTEFVPFNPGEFFPQGIDPRQFRHLNHGRERAPNFLLGTY